MGYTKYRSGFAFYAENEEEAQRIYGEIGAFIDARYAGEIDKHLWNRKTDIMERD